MAYQYLYRLIYLLMAMTLRRFYLVVLFLFGVSAVFGQANLILKSGKVIPYMKMEAQPSYLKVWDSFTREMQEVDIDSVVGYYKIGDQEDVLRIKVPDYSGDTDINYQFLPYAAPGKISIYSYTVEYQTGPDGEPLRYFYIGKGDQLDLLFPYAFVSSKSESMETFENYVRDQPEVLNEISEENYTLKNVYRLINKYNLLSYEQQASDSDPQGVVTFYRLKKGEFKGPLTMTLDDKEYTFNTYQTINLNLSTINPMKICVGEEGNMTCQLIEGIPYFRTYFKVSLNKDHQPSIEPVNKQQAFEDIQILKKFQ